MNDDKVLLKLLELLESTPELANARSMKADDGRLFIFVKKPLSRKAKEALKAAWDRLNQGHAAKVSNWKIEVEK